VGRGPQQQRAPHADGQAGRLAGRRERARAQPRHTRPLLNAPRLPPLFQVPPTFYTTYQHAGELVLLQGSPGKVKLLFETHRLNYLPMWWFSAQKLVGYGTLDARCLLGPTLKTLGLLCGGGGGDAAAAAAPARRDSLMRLAGRVAAVVPLLHAFVAGVNDHAPGDYYCEGCQGGACGRCGPGVATHHRQLC
jgi:hypothetical protein